MDVCQRFQVRNDRSLFFFGQPEVSYDDGYGDAGAAICRRGPAVVSQCILFRGDTVRASRYTELGGRRVFVRDNIERWKWEGPPIERRVVKMDDALHALEPAVVGVRLDESFVGPFVHVAQGRESCGIPEGQDTCERPLGKSARVAGKTQVGVYKFASFIKCIGDLGIRRRTDIVIGIVGVPLELPCTIRMHPIT